MTFNGKRPGVNLAHVFVQRVLLLFPVFLPAPGILLNPLGATQSMNNFFVILVFLALGYGVYSWLSDSPADPTVIGSVPLAEESVEIQLGSDSNDDASDIQVVNATIGAESEFDVVPSTSQIEVLKDRIQGMSSPEGDDLRWQLAMAYRQQGQLSASNDTLMDIYHGKGPYAARAATTLLNGNSSDSVEELTAYVVSQGPDFAGYDNAVLIRGRFLAEQEGETKQIAAWRFLSDHHFHAKDESLRRSIHALLAPIVDKWILSRRPCSVISSTYTVQSGDYLASIANRYGVTVDHLKSINELRGDLIHPGDRLKILDRKINLEVDKSSFRLDVFYDGGLLLSFPVGHGADGRTPTSEFVVDLRQERPNWYPPNRPMVPYGDPGNPLGERWLGFAETAELKGFGIHGTSQPETIGTESSEGCIRLRNEDVITLFPLVPTGTKVLIKD